MLEILAIGVLGAGSLVLATVGVIAARRNALAIASLDESMRGDCGACVHRFGCPFAGGSSAVGRNDCPVARALDLRALVHRTFEDVACSP